MASLNFDATELKFFYGNLGSPSIEKAHATLLLFRVWINYLLFCIFVLSVCIYVLCFYVAGFCLLLIVFIAIVLLVSALCGGLYRTPRETSLWLMGHSC